MHTFGGSVVGEGGRRFVGCLEVLGCFADVNDSLAGCLIGSVGSLAIGTLECCVGAGLCSSLASSASVEACVVFTSTELTLNLLPADCGVVFQSPVRHCTGCRVGYHSMQHTVSVLFQ